MPKFSYLPGGGRAEVYCLSTATRPPPARRGGEWPALHLVVMTAVGSDDFVPSHGPWELVDDNGLFAAPFYYCMSTPRQHPHKL